MLEKFPGEGSLFQVLDQTLGHKVDQLWVPLFGVLQTWRRIPRDLQEFCC
jgi:hypothetical protein